jgi:hypothetical protein
MAAEIQIDLTPPARLSRAHLLVRLLIAGATGGIAHAIGWPGGVLYLGLPALAAVLIAQHGPARFIGTDGPRILRVLGWLLAFCAYMMVLTDEFPLETARVRYEDEPNGSPTVKTAVLRIFASLPIALVLGLLGFIAAVLAVFAMIGVLVAGRYPRSWFEFQTGMLRVQARLLAYHASLTDGYPTLTFHGTGGGMPAARAI